MKKVFLLTVLVTLFVSVRGQVTIGSDLLPDTKALLDLKEGTGSNKDESAKGLFLPRVNLLSTVDFFGTNDHKEGAIVYNRNTSLSSIDATERVSPGFYYNNGSKWERLYLGNANWFYMPSIVISVENSGTYTRNLFLEYRKQFEDNMDNELPADSPSAGTSLISSPDAPNPFSTLLSADQLYYYITGYDTAVFSDLKITADGKLTYTVDADKVTDATYMNIVFVEK